MVQIAMLLFTVPFGIFIANRRTAYLAAAILFAVVFAVQTVVVAVDTPDDINVLYFVLNAATLAVGLGLTAGGLALGRRRRTRQASGAQSAG
ncbi:hypothetical protein [Parafrankia sp. EUN1f]|uniref:hypothetical protein n=1 Tax=Parafrankia sp. EUN1f TaxID=102897 RepID=UPI0001C47539|nr:hypothetical protein [Parafrankia sp. EUN1f]EFC79448.1 hypothetical protein FrEUN1fDRAFT_7431 [Parafrankia sp. EUN1f]